jgi:alpha-tubulin suppressor-like RCC1 family protein
MESEGELGNGIAVGTYTTPIQATNVTNCVQGTFSDGVGCVTHADGTVWCWGNNSLGQTGDGTMISPRLAPVQTSGLTGVTKAEAGEAFSCALKNDGTVWCWGDNSFFTPGNSGVGDGTTLARLTPIQVFANATDVVAGDGHACAIKNDSTVWCWGHNDYGQLGDNTTTDRLSPTQVVGLANVTKIALDQRNTCAITSDTQLWCWGNNWYGQVGDGTAAGDSSQDKHVPVHVKNADTSDFNGVVQVKAGVHDVCALKTDNSVWCWGYNKEGCAGDGGPLGNRVNPVPVLGMSNVTEIGVDDDFACARKTDGTIWCWGDNIDGQLGNGTTVNSSVPVQVIGFP